jgi:hypothetical protein
MNVFGYLEEVFLFFKDLMCKSSLLSTLDFFFLLKLVYMVCALINEVKNLKQEKNSKAKWENDDSREELKNKYEEIKKLCKHNQELLNDVKKVKMKL